MYYNINIDVTIQDKKELFMERLKLSEAAKFLGISRSRLYTLANSGKVPSVRIGGQGRIMFLKSELEAQLKPQLPAQPPKVYDLFFNLLQEAGITPDDMVAMLRAAHRAFIEGRMKAELQRLGIPTNQETVKNAG
jgi:excisionase family DNA binding protein